MLETFSELESSSFFQLNFNACVLTDTLSFDMELFRIHAADGLLRLTRARSRWLTEAGDPLKKVTIDE